MPYREFSLSESNVCELKMPTLNFHTYQSDLVPSNLWRVVVNNTADGGDERCVLVMKIIECIIVQENEYTLFLKIIEIEKSRTKF